MAVAAICLVQVPLLLKDMHLEMRTLGAELLAVFIRVQSQVDSKLDAIQAHVPQVGHAARTHARTNSSGPVPHRHAGLCCSLSMFLLLSSRQQWNKNLAHIAGGSVQSTQSTYPPDAHKPPICPCYLDFKP